MAAIGLREGTLMDKDKSAPAEQDPSNSSPPDNGGSTIPKSSNGVWATSTPGKSTFEPEEDPPARDSGADTAGGPAEKA